MTEIPDDTQPAGAPRGDRSSPSWLRVASFLACILLPVAWIASLGGEPDYRVTNVVRTAGALLGGGVVLRVRREDPGIPWGRLVIGGMAGSLALTALSVVIPVLGRYAAPGWLMSGAVGGVMVGLGVLALRGRGNSDSGGGTGSLAPRR
jgi:hypothetical protein